MLPYSRSMEAFFILFLPTDWIANCWSKKNSSSLHKFKRNDVSLYYEVTKIVYFIGNEHMLIAHDSNRLRFS